MAKNQGFRTLWGGVLRNLGPVVVSDTALVLFNCFFSTVNHPRYIDSHIVVLCLFAALEIGMCAVWIIQKTVLAISLVVLLLSNYCSIDWVSRKIFTNYDLGGAVFLSPSGECFSDAMVYNQQYQYIDIALNKALKDVVVDSNANCYFPTVYSNTWFFDGITAKFRYVDEVTMYDEYWDCVKNKRMDHETQNTIQIKIYQLPEKYSLLELAEKEPGYFFYSPCLGKDIRDELVENIKEVEEEVFEYRGVQIIRISW